MNDDGMFRMSTQDGLPMRMWIDSCSKCNGRIASHVKPAYSHAVEYVRADVDSVVEEAIGNAVSRAVAAEREACANLVFGWPYAQNYTADRAIYGHDMANELGEAILARGTT